MNISDNILSKASLFMAVFFTSGLGYLIYNNQINDVNIFVSVGVVVMSLTGSYKLSKKYKANNSLNKLIIRNGNSLECKSSGTISTLNIDINKIDKVSISKNYVSIIEQNNGNGYDVFLISNAQEIMDYMLNLFTKEELDTIELVSA